MCDRCVFRAESALLFREQCRAADQALRQAALQVSKAKETENILPPSIPCQESQTFAPWAQNTPTFTDCGAFREHQEFYVHNQLYPQFYQREENISQHMHIVESHNTYLDLSRYNNGSLNHEMLPNTSSYSFRPDDFDPFTGYNTIDNRPSCALESSLYNYTFTDRTQLVNHSVTHNSDNIDVSGDEVDVDIEEITTNVDININYRLPVSESVDHSIDNISYSKANTSCSNGFENLNFTNMFTQDNSETVNTINPMLMLQSTPEAIQHKESSEVFIKNRYKCETCSRLFSDESKLIDHQLTHNRKKPFECFHCGKSYSSKSKLAAHTRLHTGTNVHQCNICDKIFSYPSYLSEHMKSHNSKPVEKKASFECVQCNKTFHFAKSYKRHMKFHTGKGLFHCDVCDKLFSQKYLLKVHMRSHELTKFHKCDLCNKSFKHKSNFVEHMRTHTKIKPFVCKICDKSFAQSSHLKSHEKSHDSVRQFQCRICGKKFKLSSHLKRHVNLHSGLKMYKCDQCDQVFSQAFSLKRHTKKHLE